MPGPQERVKMHKVVHPSSKHLLHKSWPFWRVGHLQASQQLPRMYFLTKFVLASLLILWLVCLLNRYTDKHLAKHSKPRLW